MMKTIRPKILNIEPLGYARAAQEILEEFSEVTNKQPSYAELIATVGNYDCLITRLGYQIGKKILDAAPKLVVIGSATTGLDHIEVDLAEQRGIKVLSLRGESNFLHSISSTAELTWGLVLSLIRNIHSAYQDVLLGNYDRDTHVGLQLKDKCLGIVGFGRIGQMLAQYGEAFGMRVIYYDPYQKNKVFGASATTLEQLLQLSDVVTVHVPLTEQTKMLLNKDKLSLLKSTSVFVNTSRAEIVDENCLLEMINQDRLSGVGLDVSSLDAISRDESRDDLSAHRLIKSANLNNRILITPHIGGATTDGMESTEVFLAKKIREYFSHH